MMKMMWRDSKLFYAWAAARGHARPTMVCSLNGAQHWKLLYCLPVSFAQFMVTSWRFFLYKVINQHSSSGIGSSIITTHTAMYFDVTGLIVSYLIINSSDVFHPPFLQVLGAITILDFFKNCIYRASILYLLNIHISATSWQPSHRLDVILIHIYLLPNSQFHASICFKLGEVLSFLIQYFFSPVSLPSTFHIQISTSQNLVLFSDFPLYSNHPHSAKLHYYSLT